MQLGTLSRKDVHASELLVPPLRYFGSSNMDLLQLSMQNRDLLYRDNVYIPREVYERAFEALSWWKPYRTSKPFAPHLINGSVIPYAKRLV